jgi:molybdopterin-biosynthesis enzyme MoeA-like protein
MNDVQFVEAAKALAALALEKGGETFESRADFLARRLIARPFRTEELEVVKDSVEDLLEHYRAHPDDARALIDVGEMKPSSGLDPASLAAWTMAVNQLMNLDEFLVK